MKELLNAFYNQLATIVIDLWEYRFKVFVYVVCVFLAFKTLNKFFKDFEITETLPTDYKYIFPALLIVLSGIIFADAVIKIGEKIHKKHFLWKSLTQNEKEFLKSYIEGNTKTLYVAAENGTWKDSGTIELLQRKRIIYLASRISEYRGEHYLAMKQTFPFNIQDDAFKHFKTVFAEERTK